MKPSQAKPSLVGINLSGSREYLKSTSSEFEDLFPSPLCSGIEEKEDRREEKELQAALAPIITSRSSTPIARKQGVRYDRVKDNIENQSHQHIDARSKARFDGVAQEPRKGIRSGHVPGSKCIPFAQMLDSSQTLLPKDELKKRFEQEGISLDRPVMTSCGTGVTACILALGLHRLGKTDAPVYDGSWTEWGANPDTPVSSSSPIS